MMCMHDARPVFKSSEFLLWKNVSDNEPQFSRDIIFDNLHAEYELKRRICYKLNRRDITCMIRKSVFANSNVKV